VIWAGWRWGFEIDLLTREISCLFATLQPRFWLDIVRSEDR